MNKLWTVFYRTIRFLSRTLLIFLLYSEWRASGWTRETPHRLKFLQLTFTCSKMLVELWEMIFNLKIVRRFQLDDFKRFFEQDPKETALRLLPPLCFILISNCCVFDSDFSLFVSASSPFLIGPFCDSSPRIKFTRIVYQNSWPRLVAESDTNRLKFRMCSERIVYRIPILVKIPQQKSKIPKCHPRSQWDHASSILIQDASRCIKMPH